MCSYLLKTVNFKYSVFNFEAMHKKNYLCIRSEMVVVASASCMKSRPYSIWRTGSFATTKKIVAQSKIMVVVAQLVRALDCGSRGRRFEPGLPPNLTFKFV